MGKTLKAVFTILVCIAPLIYLAVIWHTLPPVVPTHFDLSGNANGFSGRGELWLINGGLTAVTIGTYFLLNNLHRIDPKRRGLQPSNSFAKLADGIVLFLTITNIIVIRATSGHSGEMTAAIFPLISLLFMFIGNVMYSLKPNYFAGIRLPWTLASDDNWRATHRVAGIVWFAGGLCLLLTSLFVNHNFLRAFIPTVLVPMILVPIAYSFWYFKNNTQNQQ